MQKSQEQIQQEIEAKLASLTPEERAAVLAADDANDRAMCLMLSRELQATIETIPGDRHHIKVNGQVMGYNEYAAWQAARYQELHPNEEADEDEEDEDNAEA